MNPAIVQGINMSIDPNKGSDILSGLREQILANALHIFPNILKDHTPYPNTGIVLPPSKIFDIIIARPPSTTPEVPSFQAVLTYGPPLARKTAVIAAPSESIEGALVRMVEATGRVVWQGMGSVTEDVKEVSLETYGARVDWELVAKAREVVRKKRGK